MSILCAKDKTAAYIFLIVSKAFPTIPCCAYPTIIVGISKKKLKALPSATWYSYLAIIVGHWTTFLLSISIEIVKPHQGHHALHILQSWYSMTPNFVDVFHWKALSSCQEHHFVHILWSKHSIKKPSLILSFFQTFKEHK